MNRNGFRSSALSRSRSRLLRSARRRPIARWNWRRPRPAVRGRRGAAHRAALIRSAEGVRAQLSMADYDVDLFVIGGGSGGVRAARMAAQHGARVMLAEEYRVGGTCVIRGCVPKKLLVYASRFRAEFEDAEGYGWSTAHSKFDWPTLITNKDHEIARLEAAYTAVLDKAGVTIVKSRAQLADAHTVQLGDGASVRAKVIL